MINVAGQMFSEYEKVLNFSNQIFKSYGDYIGDNKNKNDKLDKICRGNVKETCSEKDEVY